MFYPTEFYSEEFIKEQQKNAEKKEIRRASNLLGVAFLIMTAIMTLWSAPLGFLATAGFLDIRKVYDLLGDTTVIQGLQIAVSSVAFIFSYWIFAKMMKTEVSKVCAFSKPKEKGLVLPFVVFGLGVSGFANFLTSIAGGIFQGFGFEYNLNIPENPTNPFGVVLTFLAVAVTPALVEEFAMRGVVLGILRRFGDTFAILVSAVVFGLMHGNFVQIPFAFILGLYLGYVVIKTHSVWSAVIIHFLNNLLSVTTDYLTREMTDLNKSMVSVVYMLLLMSLAVVGLVMLSKKDEGRFSVDKKTSLLTEGEKLKTAFTAPCMIMSCIAVLVEAIFVYA